MDGVHQNDGSNAVTWARRFARNTF